MVLALVLAFSILSRQDPTVILDEVSLFLAGSLENPFHSKFCLERETPTQMAALQLSFMLEFFMFLFALPSGETQACQKKTFLRIRKKLNTKNILLHLSLSWECSGLSHILSVHKGLCCFFFLAEFPCSSLVCFPQKKGTAFIKGGFGYVLLLA